MIAVTPVREPKTFGTTARTPGGNWLKAHPNAKRPKDLWSPHLAALASGFAGRCAYAAMLDPTGGTVDHYLSFKNRPDLAYEWTNYRFASQPLNASKRTADAAVLDPYEVKAGWFEIILPSLQLQVTSAVPSKVRPRAEYTLKRLKLRHGERIIRWRQAWYQQFLEGHLTLEGLRDFAPLIAEAVERAQPPRSKPKRKARRARR